MAWAKNHTGKKFGRLTVMSRVPKYFPEAKKNNPRNLPKWICFCDCGRLIIVFANNLTGSSTQSCGCLQKERTRAANKKEISLTTTRAYRAWYRMMERCYNKAHDNYRYYGGRGISVCTRWHQFLNFFKDMGDAPQGYSLERIDVNGNYCPKNCCWIPLKDQANNKTNTKRITFKGKTLTQAQWARETGLSVQAIHYRLSRGWSIENTLLQPSSHIRLGNQYRPKEILPWNATTNSSPN